MGFLIRSLREKGKQAIWANMNSPVLPDSSDRPLGRLVPNPKLKLAEQCREVMRFRHLARRTEETYLDWIERYVRFCREAAGRWVHPRECGARELRQFLSYLASERKVVA